MSETHVEPAGTQPSADFAPVAPAPPPEQPPVEPASSAAPDPAVAPAAVEPSEAAPPTPEQGFLSLQEPPPVTESEKPSEDGPTEPPSAAEIQYEFTVPEGMTLDPERAAPLMKWLNEHSVPAGEKAQELLDMHFAAVKEIAAQAAAEQWRVFNEVRVTRRNEILADPQLGGASVETTKAAAQRVMRMFIAPQDRAEFARRLDASGMSDDIYLTRMLVAIARRFDEPVPPPPEPAPLHPRDAAGKAPRGARNPGGGLTYRHPRGNGRL